MVVGEDYYYSGTESDDDDNDVDRYVFLARQPAPSGRHAEEDATSDSEDGDDDGDATADEGELEGGGGRRKRPPGDVLDTPSLPKKAGLGLIAPPLAPTPPRGSDQTTSSPCHGKAHDDRSPREEVRNKAKKKQPRETKKQGVCGKRSRCPGREEDGDRESCRAAMAAAKTGTPGAASGRFSCNLGERCFDSHQALGGHVLGHRKKAKVATAAAASLDDAGGSGNCKLEDIAVVEEVSLKAANGVGHADKMAVCDEKKAFDDVAAGDEDVGSGDHNDGNCDISKDATAASHVDVGGDDRVGKKAIAASRRGVTNGDGDEQVAIDAASYNNDGNDNIKSKKAVVGTYHKGARGNSNVRRTPHKCKVCGTECPTGRALGGHMRKHRKRPAHSGDDGEGSPASSVVDEDCRTPLARLFGTEVCLRRAVVITGEQPADMVRTF